MEVGTTAPVPTSCCVDRAETYRDRIAFMFLALSELGGQSSLGQWTRARWQGPRSLIFLEVMRARWQERAQHAHTPHGVARDGHTFVVP